MNYKKLTKAQAKAFADDIDALPEAAFQDLEAKWESFRVDDFDPSYLKLRNKVIAVYQVAKPNGGYAIDVNSNRQSRQRLDRHGTIVVGSCETFHHYNVQGVK